MLAAFVAMLWIVPFNRVTVPVPMPVDSVLDRLVLPFLALLWLATIATGRRELYSRHRVTGIDLFIALLLVVAAFSVVHNLEVLFAIGEFDIALKKVLLLVGYVVLFWIVATVVRPAELGMWMNLCVLLAVLAALGTIYEYRFDVNLFYNWTAKLLPASFSVTPPPEDPTWGREMIAGPTDTPIETGVILAMGLAFALTGLMQARGRAQKILHAIAVTLILTGCMATIRKTGMLAPVAALLVLLAYKPRAMIRLLPLGLVMVLAIQVIAPGAISRVKAQFVGGGGFFNQKSVTGRTDDYGPTRPDMLNNLAFGRGHGSFDPDRYRFLDNEYLGRIIETGVLGLVIYLGLILAVIKVAHRAARSKDPIRARVGLVVVAGAAVYGVTNIVFDALSFPHAPYMFFFLAGLGAVAAKAEIEETAREAPA